MYLVIFLNVLGSNAARMWCPDCVVHCEYPGNIQNERFPSDSTQSHQHTDFVFPDNCDSVTVSNLVWLKNNGALQPGHQTTFNNFLAKVEAAQPKYLSLSDVFSKTGNNPTPDVFRTRFNTYLDEVTTLITLKLSNNELDDSDLKLMVQNFTNDGSVTLLLDNNNITSTGVKSIADAFSVDYNDLAMIDLSNNNIGSKFPCKTTSEATC